MLEVSLGGDAAVKKTARGLDRAKVGGLGEDGPTVLWASSVADCYEPAASALSGSVLSALKLKF